ncbi:MAG TPA: helix-turn-helix transcriptional regulator [Candidatus Nitrosotenuis sp.]|jgi:predicted transcriptional regulator|nr:helix-turn-helix transcriptional regulator [Candidatus Nitrosotenuis sp.]HIH46337.1 helix-turn-helix transcriptional regulator [Candidatus Nitrosotenuis sp.]HIH67969.1 helix-turn-helix transcriptional regulator [Candidatus Nitrosotenuis sp.]HII03765.1 helix-turn-helix transcriptional regulator [Candidatus Nitrosotenuis sp.]
MQIQLERTKTGEDKDGFILYIMSDKYCRAIIQSTIDSPKPAIEISANCKIPISTVYRRLQMLNEGKLVAISGAITREGKKHFLYKSKIKAISSSFNDGNLQVQIIPNLLN